MVHPFQRQWPAVDIRVGVLPYRRGRSGIDLMLIRRRGHPYWSIPKGHLMAGKRLCEAASIEAYEEAGIRGTLSTAPIGSYLHVKSAKQAFFYSEPVEVMLFAMEVRETLQRWPEMRSREREWVAQQEAGQRVAPGKLVDMIAGFVPLPALEPQLGLFGGPEP
jgi:8-oxo-dGTP pyrophosphatase MutT (NUDIX family)